MHNLLPSSISMVITETLKNLHLQLLRAPSKSHQKVNIKATKIFKPSSRVSGRVEVVDHQKKKEKREARPPASKVVSSLCVPPVP